MIIKDEELMKLDLKCLCAAAIAFLRKVHNISRAWNEELKIIANKNNFKLDETVGMKFNLFSKKWAKSNDSSVNYISTFLKN